MRPGTGGAMVLCCLWGLFRAGSTEQTGPQGIAGLVTCRVSVSDERTGKPILNLVQEDFTVYDGDSRREISSFERPVAELDLLVVLDASSRPEESRLRYADLRAAIEQSLQAGDRVAVMAFGAVPRLVVPWSSGRSDIVRAFQEVERIRIQQVPSRGRVLKALAAAEKLVLAEPGDRRRARAVVAVSHNEEGADDQERARLTKRLLAADVVLVGLFAERCDWWPAARQTRAWELPLPRIPGQSAKCVERPNQHTIDPIALATGGEVGDARVSAGEFLRSTLERIRHRYLLSFLPHESTPPAGGVRPFKVELAPAARRRCPTAVVRHRVGYVFPDIRVGVDGDAP